MKKLSLLLITVIILMSSITTAEAQNKVTILTPKGAFPIAVGDMPAMLTNGKVHFVAQDSISKSLIPAKVLLTSGKTELTYLITVGVKLGGDDRPSLPFGPKDSIDIVVSSPGYRTVKERIKVKPDQYVNIRMAPIKE